MKIRAAYPLTVTALLSPRGPFSRRRYQELLAKTAPAHTSAAGRVKRWAARPTFPADPPKVKKSEIFSVVGYNAATLRVVRGERGPLCEFSGSKAACQHVLAYAVAHWFDLPSSLEIQAAARQITQPKELELTS